MFKKALALLIVTVTLCCNTAVFALNDDVDMEFDMEDGSSDVFSVGTEQGKDDGYVINVGNTYTAIPYDGNEFLGWYKNGASAPCSTNPATKLSSGEFIAKFQSRSLVNENGYELFETGTELLNGSWFHAGTQDPWVNLKICEDYAKSGKKSLKIYARQQQDIYLNLTELKANTDYVVSYYWMLPVSATTTKTANDGYYGSAIGTTDTKKIQKCTIQGDYTGSLNQSFTGGEWNKTTFTFNSDDNTALRLFLYYYSDQNTGNDSLYLDELMIYEAEKPDNPEATSYTVNVTAENGYAFLSNEGAIKKGDEACVTAAPYGGYQFDGWYEGGIKVSDEQIYKFKVTSNRALTAKCSPETTEYTPDIDNSGAVNLNDLVTLAQAVADWDVKVNESAADLDGSGEADLNDVTLFARYLAGWEVKNQMISQIPVLPQEDLTDPNLKATLLAGESEYFNKSTLINKGNWALIAKAIKKAQNGESLTVVGIGGSVTQGGVKDSAGNDRSYGKLASEWFERQFGITVTYKNAGIGSTGSLVGVHRLYTDVIRHKPDLVFVDYCVNDVASSNGSWPYKETYEAILRRLLKQEIAVIALVFGDADYTAPKFSPTALEGHLPSMLYYDVPVIDYYGALWRYIDAGVADWYEEIDGTVSADSLTRDKHHPSATGHKIIASAICYYLQDVLNSLKKTEATVPAIPEEPFFKNAELYETATFLASTDYNGYSIIEPAENTDFISASVHNSKMGTGWKCQNENGNGGKLTFTLKAVTSVSIFLEQSTAGGRATVTINGETVLNNASTKSGSKQMWPYYNKVFDTPRDITVTITCNEGAVAVAPIGVTY